MYLLEKVLQYDSMAYRYEYTVYLLEYGMVEVAAAINTGIAIACYLQ